MLELVEGPTLADRISQGPIPVDEALPIAKQIAEALEAAHEQGVIHRDLKPANIKVREDGTVKVLDFGLAKALDTTPEGDPSQSPTLTAAATQMGVIMGTAAYMSPEQARGKPIDKRADIWAFGVVLLEMLTGRKVFEGEDVSMTLSSVLQREPDWSHLPSAVSPSLSVFLNRCLEKDPKHRVHNVADVRLAMEGAFETTASASPTIAAQPARWRPALPLAVAASVVVGLVTRWLAYISTQTGARSSMSGRFPMSTTAREMCPSAHRTEGPYNRAWAFAQERDHGSFAASARFALRLSLGRLSYCTAYRKHRTCAGLQDASPRAGSPGRDRAGLGRRHSRQHRANL